MRVRFFSHSKLQCKLSYGVRTPPCAVAYIYICTHVKDPVVHVRVRWTMETLKHPARTLGWVARLCCSLLTSGKATRIMPWEKSHWDNTVVKSKVKEERSKKSSVTACLTAALSPYSLCQVSNDFSCRIQGGVSMAQASLDAWHLFWAASSANRYSRNSTSRLKMNSTGPFKINFLIGQNMGWNIDIL